MRPGYTTLLATIMLAACSAPVPQPVPQPRPQPAPAPIVTPPPAAPRPADWVDWPIEPGTWVYREDERGSIALFGAAGANATLTLRCDKGRARVYLSAAGTGATGSFTIRASSTMKSFAPVQASSMPPYVAAEILPGDAILDAIAYSRGRFAIEVGGLRSMAVPNHAEVGRVVEDCRA